MLLPGLRRRGLGARCSRRRRGEDLLNLTACSNDGAPFVLMADDPVRGDLTVHSISKDGKTLTYQANGVFGYRYITAARRLFASDRYVGTLVDTRKATDLSSKPGDTYISLVLVYNRTGELKSAVPVPSDIDLKGFGIFDSGNVLLISMNPGTKAAQLTVLAESGEQLNTFPLFDNDFNTAPNAAAKQPLSHSPQFSGDGLELLQLVARNGNLLAVPTMTSQPIVEVNESGVVRTYPVDLPYGMAIESLMNTDGAIWYVKVWGNIQTRPDSGTTMTEGPIMGINPADGDIRIGLTPPSFHPPRILCEHAGEFLGLATNRDSGRLDVESGSISR